ncbi:hypothetical protein L585_09380 [Pantoea ananatis BRT175]|uniref:hypothetical protein n=1 Tax=Pantoea ananas TaxID=553 RepID=UPI0003B224F6|nr:hypothetical protein [Pantoea ananatis]ERM14401.1 hypothetical protein L585_09380 [Pantoea ananatis BRT175]
MGLRDLTFRKAVTLKDFLPCLSVAREASDTLCQLNAERAGSKNKAFIDAYHDDKMVTPRLSVE